MSRANDAIRADRSVSWAADLMFAQTSPEKLHAEEFRRLMLHFEEEEIARRENTRHLMEEKFQEETRMLLKEQLSEVTWYRMLNEARVAAQKGAEEHLLLRFPCALCNDRGRAVNAPDPSWPMTLRGLAAEVFTRWKKELRSRGFVLQARVVEFREGLPGDIGLFLGWGKI